MNERIRELAEQANAKELGWAYYRGKPGPENAVALHSVDLELFAELILTEVISTIYRSDISDKKQEKLVDELAYKFGMK